MVRLAAKGSDGADIQPEAMNLRVLGLVQGIVQGVGFRPFVYRLARGLSLSGCVANTSTGVEIQVQGLPESIRLFQEALEKEAPPLARIHDVQWTPLSLAGEEGFEIRPSLAGEGRSTLISPDVAICSECLAELRDPRDRRFQYPFINCTNCGPRYTIIMDIPYDRPSTTMGVFPMCPACREEYHDPSSRRFHAQPNACGVCGPRTSLHDGKGRLITCADPVQEAISLLVDGKVMAIKGLGGFHLAVDACNPEAVLRLRRQKHREEKPLAIMVRDVEMAKRLAWVERGEKRLLTSFQRPIVLLQKKPSRTLAPQVAPGNPCLGVMLPYTPLHVLLLDGPFEALVMTSGNRTEEPINVDNLEAFRNLDGVADAFLTHNRDIYLRSDDSVLREVEGIPRQIRRSRGYVPVPVPLSGYASGLPSVLGLGGELKNTICLIRGNQAFLSQHIGDLENLETLDFFHLTIEHLQRILQIRPRLMVHDRNPDFLSTRFAKEQKDMPLCAVQHHHAHIVACMAEHGLQGPVIGVALDGTGLGTDGQIWGGEILLCDQVSFRRAAHLESLALPGGDAAARHPWRMALSCLEKAYGHDLLNLPIPFVRGLHSQATEAVLQMIRRKVYSPLTSSCGRLFDAISALLDLRTSIAYEGQAAMELEWCQVPQESGRYAWKTRKEGGAWVLETDGIIRGVVEDLARGEDRGRISRRFHQTVADMFGEACCQLAAETGIQTVALSGGCFQNASLLQDLTRVLRKGGLKPFSHALTPSNDGCISLGQALAGAMVLGGTTPAFEEICEISG